MKVSKKLIYPLFLFLMFTSYAKAQTQNGLASFYADKFEGKQTANGDKYKHNKLTAAHKFLPFGTIVKVTNLSNLRSVEVVINDRGPFVPNRIIDLSKSAAESLQFTAQGLTEVEIEIIDAGDGKANNTQVPLKTTVEEDTYFSLQVDQEEPDGYGVQIASFRNLDNLMRLSENLKKSYGHTPLIEVKNLNGEKVYAIILGSFKNRSKADNLKFEIDDRFPDAFVIKY